MKTGNKLIRYHYYHFLKYNSLMNINRDVINGFLILWFSNNALKFTGVNEFTVILSFLYNIRIMFITISTGRFAREFFGNINKNGIF